MVNLMVDLMVNLMVNLIVALIVDLMANLMMDLTPDPSSIQPAHGRNYPTHANTVPAGPRGSTIVANVQPGVGEGVPPLSMKYPAVVYHFQQFFPLWRVPPPPMKYLGEEVPMEAPTGAGC
ncbi:hypothetical protein FOCC_FOCC000554 [Frankliniella occidentalis]|nr:hypothetical protein FOCC_FOCC000554 [Frankliniella occidentalis]